MINLEEMPNNWKSLYSLRPVKVLGAQRYRASFPSGDVVDFATEGAARWTQYMDESVIESRLRRNAR